MIVGQMKNGVNDTGTALVITHQSKNRSECDKFQISQNLDSISALLTR